MEKQPGSMPAREANSADGSDRDRQDARALIDRQELEDFLMYYDDLVGRTCLIPVGDRGQSQTQRAAPTAARQRVAC